MAQLLIKGHERQIELCFNECEDVSCAIRLLEEKKSFLENADITVSYSGIDMSYNDEMKLFSALKRIVGSEVKLVKKHRLSREQIKYSLDDGETLCLVINKSLRSGETVTSRGDVLVYGDVNPGANIIANGNVTVMGALRGNVCIIEKGSIYATYMNPIQIRIGNVCSYNKKQKNVGCAFAREENGEIILKCL